MARRNRVTPRSELIATPARGLVYGNRGCLHDDRGEIRRRYDGKRWIACQLRFRDWRRPSLMQPGRFTELFFLDEATAFAAGHRPCALCRRADFDRFARLWLELHPGQRGADAIDAQLHAERIDLATRRQRLHSLPAQDLPDLVFVSRDDAPWLVLGERLLLWTPGGYTTSVPRPTDERMDVVTPPSLTAVLARGWSGLVPLVHPSAR
jgi:hypothetical protein